MPRLNLIIAGAQRSATTSLKRALSASPEIHFLSNQPEALSHNGEYVGFPFATPFNSRSMIGLADEGAAYESITASAEQAKYYATKWPYFMVYPHIACNIRQHLPNAMLLFILRNPTDCLWSSFKKRYKGDDLSGDFSQYVDQAMKAIEETWDADHRSKWQHMFYCDEKNAVTLDRGFYFPQMMNFIHLFGWSHVHFVNYRDFADAPSQALAHVFSWLDLEEPAAYDGLETRHNSSAEHTAGAIASAKMCPEIRARLDDFYRPSNERLCEYLDWDCDAWTAA